MRTLEKISPLWLGTSARGGPIPEPLVWFGALQSGRKDRMTDEDSDEGVSYCWCALTAVFHLAPGMPFPHPPVEDYIFSQ